MPAGKKPAYSQSIRAATSKGLRVDEDVLSGEGAVLEDILGLLRHVGLPGILSRPWKGPSQPATKEAL